ncbi:MAG: ParB N-terminal domain-containing protein [Pirellulales bacterium]
MDLARARRPLLVKVNEIRTDGGTQIREEIDESVVAEYLTAIQNGAVLPPIVVFFDGDGYYVADGFHRLQANEQAGFKSIPCEIHQGTLDDAIFYACGANSTHGQKRTNAEKRRAVETALSLPAGAEMSDRAIAKHCGVSVHLVADVRQGTTEISDAENEADDVLRREKPGRIVPPKSKGIALRPARAGRSLEIMPDSLSRSRLPAPASCIPWLRRPGLGLARARWPW